MQKAMEDGTTGGGQDKVVVPEIILEGTWQD
jgi:hypothetical protein